MTESTPACPSAQDPANVAAVLHDLGALEEILARRVAVELLRSQRSRPGNFLGQLIFAWRVILRSTAEIAARRGLVAHESARGFAQFIEVAEDLEIRHFVDSLLPLAARTDGRRPAA